MSVSSGAVHPTPPSPPLAASPDRCIIASGVAVLTLCGARQVGGRQLQAMRAHQRAPRARHSSVNGSVSDHGGAGGGDGAHRASTSLSKDNVVASRIFATALSPPAAAARISALIFSSALRACGKACWKRCQHDVAVCRRRADWAGHVA